MSHYHAKQGCKLQRGQADTLVSQKWIPVPTPATQKKMLPLLVTMHCHCNILLLLVLCCSLCQGLALQPNSTVVSASAPSSNTTKGTLSSLRSNLTAVPIPKPVSVAIAAETAATVHAPSNTTNGTLSPLLGNLTAAALIQKPVEETVEAAVVEAPQPDAGSDGAFKEW